MRSNILKEIFSGLSRKVMLWFLVITLAPLCITSWISYQNARTHLLENTSHTLIDASRFQTEVIKNNFTELQLTLEAEADRESTSRLLQQLVSTYQASGMSSADFVTSYPWAQLVDQYAGDLNNFQYNYGYHDILLIDTLGNILYNRAHEGYLGKNLWQGNLEKTLLAKTAKTVLQSGKFSFSDLEFFGTRQQLAGFMMTPLLGPQGEKIGLIALQLSRDNIMRLVGQGAQFGETGRRYLVGSDQTLRSPGALGDDYPTLERKIKSTPLAGWVDEQHGHTRDDNQIVTYTGPLGNNVLGIQTLINIAGVRWIYVAEIDEQEAFATSRDLAILTAEMIIAMTLLVGIIAALFTRSIVKPIVTLSGAVQKVSEGRLDQQVRINTKNEIGDLAHGFNQMIEKLRLSDRANTSNNWLREGAKNLSDQMQGDQELAELSRAVIGFLCGYLPAQIGAFYIVSDKKIKLCGSYAFKARKGFINQFAFGEGMVGQAALEKQPLILSHIPDDYLAIASGLGETVPDNICVFPVIWNGQVIALLEFGMTGQFNELQSKLLEMASPAIATALQTALSREQTKALLEKTQVQAEELQVREEELTESNSTLERQAMELKRSQTELEERNEQLQTQQEELRVANEELEERADDLKSSRMMLENRNLSLEEAKQELERKARELEISTRYKSEFLANMSHELRTPLNSLLILAKMLAENKQGNMTKQQVDYSQTVYEAGSDLLTLINDILDLAKIESGKVDITSETLYLDDLVGELQRKFKPLAEEKGLLLEIDSTQAPEKWSSDGQKLGQILKNFISNAIKFTEHGKVTLQIGPVPEKVSTNTMDKIKGEWLAFTVHDTGIGIQEDKQQVIFEAFQQADGTTSRQYGGTGLGLSISRELAKILGGEIHLRSEAGRGSAFTLIVPVNSPSSIPKTVNHASPPSTSQEKSPAVPTSQPDNDGDIKDDRQALVPDDRSVLIVEDDHRFAGIVADIARTNGFKVLMAKDGRSGLHMADYYQPSGIVLDIGLPDISGWQVMEKLKDSGKTRHIPVHIMSAHDKSLDAMRNGAIGFITKPVNSEQIDAALNNINAIIEKPVKKLLLVEDCQVQSESLLDLVGKGGDVKTLVAKTGKQALDILKKESFDCIVLDLNLPDINGLEILKEMRSDAELRHTPVVVYTGRDLDAKERATLDQLAQSIIVKDARSPERILDDTALFLHRLEADLPEKQRQMIRMLHNTEELFMDRKVLLVDDDMRNIFSLSAVLQEKKMQVLTAHNGIEALEALEANPDTAIVLMDIMMPVMDGYEAMRKIRDQECFSRLPIIALTAKAMKGDRAQCIESGASDYLTKPLKTEKLLSMMRVWLYR